MSYRKCLVGRLLINFHVGRELKIDLLGALSTLSGSWADVAQETIRNCFRRAGFREHSYDSENSAECNEAIAGVAKVWSRLLKFPDTVDGSTADEFVSVDGGVATTGELANEGYTADILTSTNESG